MRLQQYFGEIPFKLLIFKLKIKLNIFLPFFVYKISLVLAKSVVVLICIT